MDHSEKLKVFRSKKNYLYLNTQNNKIEDLENLDIKVDRLNQGITFIIDNPDYTLDFDLLNVFLNARTEIDNKLYNEDKFKLQKIYSDDELFFYYWKINPFYLDQLYNIKFSLTFQSIYEIDILNTEIEEFFIKENDLYKLNEDEVIKNKKIIELLSESRKDLNEIKNRIEVNTKQIQDIEIKVEKSLEISSNILKKYETMENNYNDLQNIHYEIEQKFNDLNDNILPSINDKVNSINSLYNDNPTNIIPI